MKISYAIPVCNEHVELEKLLSFLVKHIDENDEIVVQCDQGNTTYEVYKVIDSFSVLRLKKIEFPLNGHFSNFKNILLILSLSTQSIICSPHIKSHIFQDCVRKAMISPE